MSRDQESTLQAPTLATMPMEQVLEAIRNEPGASLRERERTEFSRLAAPFERALVLFGAGFLGREILAGLRRAGIEPLAFADNNRNIWDTEVDGLNVLSPDEAARTYGQNACFVVTIFNGSRPRQQLRGLGCARVVPFAPLVWKYSEYLAPQFGIDSPHVIADELDEVQAAYSLMSDAESRDEFRQQVIWRYWLDYECLSSHHELSEIYFPDDLIAPLEDEVFIDCGAFDGGTIDDFLRRRRDVFRHAAAMEPDRCNRKVLGEYIAGLPGSVREKISTLPYAVSNCNGRTSFTTTASMGSGISAKPGADQVECRRLDDIPWRAAPTFIKMDVEGAEMDALAGASSIIRKQTPVLAICLYHRSTDLWRVPNFIHSLCNTYEFFVRRYAEESSEMVCYAVPPGRLSVKSIERNRT